MNVVQKLSEYAELMEINEYCSTRTACAYAVSIDMAHIIVDEIRDLVMLIDWSISVALAESNLNHKSFGAKICLLNMVPVLVLIIMEE